MKTIVAIAVAAALSVGVANATVTAPGSGTGELIEWVVDNTTGQVYARGIQVPETSVLPGSVIQTTAAYSAANAPYATGTTIPTITADANLTTFLAQDGGGDSFSFGLLSAGQNTNGATGYNPGSSVVIFTSSQSIADSNLNVPSTSLTNTLVTDVQATVTTLNGQLPAGAGTSGNVSSQFSAGSAEFNLYSANIGTTTALGTDQNLYAITGNTNKPQAGQLYTAGLVTMLANGTLEEVAVTTTPLPAAVWLFGSGLLGLLGVGRRRAA
jgi:hypothetical protein